MLGIEVNVSYFRSPEQVKESETPYLILTDRIMGMPDPEDIIRLSFSSKSESNILGYANPAVEDLLRAGETEKSWSKRIKIFQRVGSPPCRCSGGPSVLTTKQGGHAIPSPGGCGSSFRHVLFRYKEVMA